MLQPPRYIYCILCFSKKKKKILVKRLRMEKKIMLRKERKLCIFCSGPKENIKRIIFELLHRCMLLVCCYNFQFQFIFKLVIERKIIKKLLN